MLCTHLTHSYMTHIYTSRIRLNIVLLLGLCLIFLIAPNTTSAYFMTNQGALSVEPHGTLFFIEYTFGTEKNDIYMPIRVALGSTTATNTIGYHVYNEDGVVVPGKASAIILSNAPFDTHTGMYTTKKSTSKKYTLVSVFTPDTVVPDQKYRLQVNHLPFNFNGTQQLQLNPSELQYYTTDYTN